MEVCNMFLDNAIRYVEVSFGVEIETFDWVERSKLPFYLKKAFAYNVIELFNQRFLLVNILEEELDFDTIQKHRLRLRTYLDANEPIIFVFNQLSNYLRKQLMNEKIAFIVPGKQIFILELGSIFSEKQRARFSTKSEKTNTKWMPSTQALFLYLMRTDDFSSSMERIAKKLDLAKMSISRGFVELANLGLIEKVNGVGKDRFQFNSSKQNTWEKAVEHFIDPILKSYSIHKDTIDERIQNQFVVSGVSALTYHSMLSQPANRVYGITSKRFKEVLNEVIELPKYDKDAITIQVFNHTMQEKEGVLDPLSIALILKDEKDERIQSEVKHMLELYFNKEEMNDKKEASRE